MPPDDAQVSEMVERVAAILNGHMGRAMSLAVAHECINAMLEPTFDMEVAGTEAWMQRRVDLEYAGLAWRAMINEALVRSGVRT